MVSLSQTRPSHIHLASRQVIGKDIVELRYTQHLVHHVNTGQNTQACRKDGNRFGNGVDPPDLSAHRTGIGGIHRIGDIFECSTNRVRRWG
jgi:hypothetical protein